MKQRRGIEVLCIATVLLISGWAGAQVASGKKNAPTQSPSVPLPATNDATYTIGPEDVLAINVWKEPEVSVAQTPVRPDGKISLPLINDVQAAGMTPMHLSEEITTQLKKYLS